MSGKAKLNTGLRIAEILLKPTDPKKGPPLPDGLDISWPGFFSRGLKRLITEPPWVTIPKYGWKEELRKEFEILTGKKL
jgi:hypothetical protein